MVTLTGSSSQMEEQAKKLSDSELAELAFMNDGPVALKARGEIARRNSETGVKVLRWARIAGWCGIAGLILSVVAIVATILTASP